MHSSVALAKSACAVRINHGSRTASLWHNKSLPEFCRLSKADRARRCSSSSSMNGGAPLYSDQENVIDITNFLAEMRQQNEDFIFEDHDYDEPVWEHEERFTGTPMTVDDLQQQRQEPPQLFSDPQQAVKDIVSAYTAEQGFKEISVEELSVALTAGGLIDLLLDVRSAAEFQAGPVIAGAINIPLDALSDTVRSGQLDKHITDSHVVVVCGSGQRSAQATVRLGKVFGFQHVSNVAGGMAAWLKMQQELRSPGGGGCGCGGGGCH